MTRLNKYILTASLLLVAACAHAPVPVVPVALDTAYDRINNNVVNSTDVFCTVRGANTRGARLLECIDKAYNKFDVWIPRAPKL